MPTKLNLFKKLNIKVLFISMQIKYIFILTLKGANMSWCKKRKHVISPQVKPSPKIDCPLWMTAPQLVRTKRLCSSMVRRTGRGETIIARAANVYVTVILVLPLMVPVHIKAIMGTDCTDTPKVINSHVF